jgi:hypothetical protein
VHLPGMLLDQADGACPLTVCDGRLQHSRGLPVGVHPQVLNGHTSGREVSTVRPSGSVGGRIVPAPHCVREGAVRARMFTLTSKPSPKAPPASLAQVSQSRQTRQTLKLTTHIPTNNEASVSHSAPDDLLTPSLTTARRLHSRQQHPSLSPFITGLFEPFPVPARQQLSHQHGLHTHLTLQRFPTTRNQNDISTASNTPHICPLHSPQSHPQTLAPHHNKRLPTRLSHPQTHYTRIQSLSPLKS